MDISSLNHKKIIFYSSKVLVIWICLTLIVIFFGDKLLIPLLHYFASVAEFFTDGFSIEVKLNQVKSEPAVIMIVTNLKEIFSSDNNVLVAPGVTTAIYAHTVNILVPMVILFSLILAWPITSTKQALIMITSGMLTVLVILLLTVPFQLLGIYENELNNQALLNHSTYDFSLIHYWQVFCDAGGVWLLALIGASIAITLGNWQLRR